MTADGVAAVNAGERCDDAEAEGCAATAAFRTGERRGCCDCALASVACLELSTGERRGAVVVCASAMMFDSVAAAVADADNTGDRRGDDCGACLATSTGD